MKNEGNIQMKNNRYKISCISVPERELEMKYKRTYIRLYYFFLKKSLSILPETNFTKTSAKAHPLATSPFPLPMSSLDMDIASSYGVF